MFNPTILKTKQELANALDDGTIKVSKYNMLNHKQKLFVQLVAFGDYKAHQAIRVVDENIKDPYSAGQRWAANPLVAEVLEELTYQKNKLWMNEVSGSRNMALRKLEYIMSTTEDEALQVVAAKAILDQATKATTKPKEQEQVTGFIFNIRTPSQPETYDPNEVIEVVPNQKGPVKMVLNYQKTSKENYEK